MRSQNSKAFISLWRAPDCDVIIGLARQYEVTRYSVICAVVRWQGPISVQYRPYKVFLLFPYLRGVLFKNVNDATLSSLGNSPNMQIKAAITEISQSLFVNISVTMHDIKINFGV